jgi:hypothetical protein
MVTIHARCTHDIEYRTAMTRASTVLQEEIYFTSKLNFNLGNKLIKYYNWSMALYGAETWTLRKADKISV